MLTDNCYLSMDRLLERQSAIQRLLSPELLISLKLDVWPPSKSFFLNLHAFFPWGAPDSWLLTPELPLLHSAVVTSRT